MREVGRHPGAVWLLVAAALAAAALTRAASHDEPRPDAGDPEGMGSVVHVGDGDTVTVRFADGRVERVRLIGIDAPELHESRKLDRDATRARRSRASIQALGARARDAAEAALLGRRVRVETDVEPRDRYGRLLAYLWRDDGTLVNELLVRDGWARLYTFPPNVRYVERLRTAQQAARGAHRGLWADAPPASRREPRRR